MTALAQPLTGNVHVTGRRVVATLIDLLVLGVGYRLLAASLGLPLSLSSQLDGTNEATDGDFASRVADNYPAILAYFGIVALYYIVLESVWGRTIGKWVTGIRVVTATGGKPGFLPVLARTAFRLVDGFASYLVGFLVAVSSSRRQRVGDMVANTLVIRA
ncbi:RDD family protein [Dactylosporangium sp. CA-139066]|uniref:RDD family protein n=1 Tax=Dactylosporangium sp. CA-139066 TaxID=3239930 RepID=UPI003D8F9548